MYYLSDICSLCLTQKKNLQSILSQDRDGTLVEDKLKIILMEIVHFQPNIPKFICNNCLLYLNSIYKFRQSCLENITILNKYVKKLEADGPTDGPYKNLSVTLTALKHEKDSEEDENQNNSELCENSIQKICLQDNVIGESVFIKEEIDDAFQENSIFIEEYNETNSPEDVIKIENETEETQENSLEDIVIDKQDEDIFANCQTSFESFKEFHKKNKGITSNNNPTPSETNTQNQTEISKNLKCKDCNITFLNPSQLEIHSHTHTDKRSYKCKTCHQSFSQPHVLQSHLRTHSGEKPFACEVCEKAFSQLSSYLSHKRIHDDVRPYKCSICNKAFTQNSNLIRHMRIHTGEKPFKCSVCHIKFRDNSNLTKHMRRHSGDKPFNCPFCEYKCALSNGLRLHMRTHTGEKPYHCHLCEYRAASSGGLNYHIRKHFDGSPENLAG